MGIEQIFHPNSLEMIIAGIKKRALGDSSVTRITNMFFKNDENAKVAVQIAFYGLNDPAEGLLILAKRE